MTAARIARVVDATSPTFDEQPIQSLHALWVFAGELGYDFRGLTVEQVAHIAPFVVEAAWRRGMGPLLLIHGADRAVARELREQWVRRDWMAWSYSRSSLRHATSSTRPLLALRPDPGRRRSPLPYFEPGHEDFDEPPCVGEATAGDQCSAPAAADRPYCGQHDPIKDGGL